MKQMNALQRMQKMDNIHKRMYAELKKGNIEKAYKLQDQYIKLANEAFEKKYGKIICG